MGKVCCILGCGKDFLHTWLQQILHNGRCVNILKRHMSSANLMKTFVNPNVNVFSLTLSRKKKNPPFYLSSSSTSPSSNNYNNPSLWWRKRFCFEPNCLLIWLVADEVSDLCNEADGIILGALPGFSNWGM